MRIKKCNCGGDYSATGINNDNIIEITCSKCKNVIDLSNNPYVPKRKRELIAEFNKIINGV